MIDSDYNLVLDGVTPRPIDEWQNITPLWDYVRYESDKRNKTGQFILTGSSIRGLETPFIPALAESQV